MPRRTSYVLLFSLDLHFSFHPLHVGHYADTLFGGKQPFSLHQFYALLEGNTIKSNLVSFRISVKHRVHDGRAKVYVLSVHHGMNSRVCNFRISAEV